MLPASLGKNIAEKKPRQNAFSYTYLSILFTAAKNAEIRGLWLWIKSTDIEDSFLKSLKSSTYQLLLKDYFLLPTKLTVNFYTLWGPNTMFPLHQIIFHFVLEQTTFNGNSSSFWVDLEWFLFPFRMEHYILISFDKNKWTMGSKKSYRIIHFWNGME